MAIIILYSSCSKKDEYTEWKILNQTWLEQHKNDPDFHQTESGLCYKVIHQGYMRRPSLSSYITVNYEGKFIDGTVFDKNDSWSNYLAYLVKGWQEGLQKMNAGGHYIFYIPYELGYGEDGSGANVPPYSTLIFDIELLECQ